ncbi:MAG: redox-sensing transcriptional repressor Rex [Firmicutes bacterium]|nr:redox-sensing transcriptional repressor Rex [Bacillota bacterium]
MAQSRIPDVTVRRLPIYLRVVESMRRQGAQTLSSQEMSRLTGFSSEQIRKDLAYFGAFGVRGVGYETEHLAWVIRNILGLAEPVAVALVGVGHLGSALVRHNVTQPTPMRIRFLFDAAPEKVGSFLGELPIRPVATIPAVLPAAGVQVAIVAVPPEAAQEVTDLLVEGGVRAILNFAPLALRVPPDVHVQNVDLNLALETLAYYRSHPGVPGRQSLLATQEMDGGK